MISIYKDAQALNGYEEKAIMVLIDAVANWTKYKLKEKYVKACGVTLKALGGSNEQVKKIIEVIFEFWLTYHDNFSLDICSKVTAKGVQLPCSGNELNGIIVGDTGSSFQL